MKLNDDDLMASYMGELLKECAQIISTGTATKFHIKFSVDDIPYYLKMDKEELPDTKETVSPALIRNVLEALRHIRAHSTIEDPEIKKKVDRNLNEIEEALSQSLPDHNH